MKKGIVKPHCEHFVMKYLPGLRALLVKELIERYHLSQSEVAELLGITQPSVSQYMRQTRGKSKEPLNEKIMQEIENLAAKVLNRDINDDDLSLEFCELCSMTRDKKLVCDIARELLKKQKNMR